MIDDKQLNDINKNYLEKEQKKFNLKTWDDNPYNFDDLCEEHQKVAKTILYLHKECKDPNLFEHYVITQFKLKGEKVISKNENPLVKIIHDNGFSTSVQGYVTEIENNTIVKYPVVAYVADIRHYEKVYRNILQNLKEFFKNNKNLLK